MLCGQNLRVCLNRWDSIPDQPQCLEQTLSSCGAVAVCIGSGEMGPWQQRELNSALDRQRRETSFPLIPVLLPGAEPPLDLFGQKTWVDFRTGLSQDQPLHLLAAALRGEPLDAELRERQYETLASLCPYKGLQFFREEDAAFFFGRDSAIDELYQSVQNRQFIALVGPSGSGKSSLVRAGLLPKLRREAGKPWEIATMVPGSRPFHALAAALLPLLETELGEIDRLAKTAALAQKLAEGTIALGDVVGRILEKRTLTRRILLLVDQWEELYTYQLEDAKSAKESTDFASLLLQTTETGLLTVVLALRADFMGHALVYRPLVDSLKGGIVNLGPMNDGELYQAITRPAAQLQVGFESGLTERIISDADGQPGHLPLVEFVLRRLWVGKCGTMLRHRDYEAAGWLEGAIAQHADYALIEIEKGKPSRGETVRDIFRQLVRQGEGTGDTRRRLFIDDLGGGEETRAVVGKLAAARLVATRRELGSDTVEVAHEALFRHWPTLRSWLEQERADLLLRREAERAALICDYRALSDQGK